MRRERDKLLHEMKETFEWNKWSNEIPFLSMKEDWEVKIIPPYGVGVARFLIKKDEASVSIYLDCYRMAGATPKPYWEIFPHEYQTFEDAEMEGMWIAKRYYLDESEELVDGIEESIQNQKKHDS